MANDFLLTLKIDKVGDLEALNALNALDAKGRRIIEGVSGATGRAMGEVALAYERGSKSARVSLEEIAKEHERNIAVMVREQNAAEKMSIASGAGLGRIRQGMTSLVAQLTGTMPVLDRVLGAFGGLAVGSLPLIGVLGGIAAITEGYKLLTSQAKDAAEQADALADAFSRIAHMDLVSQSQEATKLYSGDKYAKDPLDRFGISGLTQQKADLEARLKAGTSTFRDPTTGEMRKLMSEDAAQASETLDKVKRKLSEIVPLYQSIMGPGGSFADASARQVASDQPGFITDALNAQDKADKAGEKLAKKLADAYQRELDKDLKEATKLAVARGVEDAELANAAQMSIVHQLVPTKEQIDKAVSKAAENVKEAIAKDPVLTGQPALSKGRQLAQGQSLERIREMMGLGAVSLKEAMAAINAEINEFLTGTLRDSIASGFETAFSGQGIRGFIDGFFSTMLGAIGGYMETMGEQFVIIGLALDALSKALASLDGPAAIAAGVFLIAAGAGLKAIGNSFGHSHGASGGSGSSSGSGGLAQIIDRGTINPDSYSRTNAASIQQRPQIVFAPTVLGARDPVALRNLDEMIRSLNQRGSLAGGRG